MTAVLSVGALRETAERERRVALDPDVVAALVSGGHPVSIESGAGSAASFPDAAYRTAGASVTSRDAVVRRCDVLAVVRPPDPVLAAELRADQVLLGLVEPSAHGDLMADLAGRGVTVVAFELLPRTLSRAQTMDAVSSQASAAGYRAGVLAAASFDRYFPMMITASGTAKPASVLVIGAGVAGLQAIGTAKRLGAVVTGYDVRPASRGEVESVGARFLTSSVAEGAGAGGYARAMTAAETATQQTELADHVVGFDVVITTAKVPGHTPPLLVTATHARSHAARVGVHRHGRHRTARQRRGLGRRDSASSPTAASWSSARAISPATSPASSSHMYASNVAALLASAHGRRLPVVDPDDEVHAGHRGLPPRRPRPPRRSPLRTEVAVP